jgi:hypothetical protein
MTVNRQIKPYSTQRSCVASMPVVGLTLVLPHTAARQSSGRAADRGHERLKAR